MFVIKKLFVAFEDGCGSCCRHTSEPSLGLTAPSMECSESVYISVAGDSLCGVWKNVVWRWG